MTPSALGCNLQVVGLDASEPSGRFEPCTVSVVGWIFRPRGIHRSRKGAHRPEKGHRHPSSLSKDLG
ncbi:hypothetical protein E2562_003129 [Oryza meyeriana var. granulata]|uniref:Uncharacterized protein n=1 Tax=Oryza meyeriana var. granulata TaxID=110450 RepID=A0A6G1E995_9ORYZ|nr:hypothetical protein E2562_003129 [Oryza meyeriana var. granulata]